jgi:2-dehydro-3-deoxyphosphogluconate aldolase / (4S)-4-hydroxy-2-oxoglutarate aldolase
MPVNSIFDKLESTGVLAVLVVDNAADAVPLAEALLAGGVNAMELTLRTDAAIDALKAIRKSLPDMIVGIGTILKPDQVREVVAEGAAFGVSPGINPKVVEAAIDAGLPFAPGIATPSEVELALSFDCRRLKFFPAEAMGGLGYLRAMAPPYQHLGVKYVPLGGVGPKNLADYIADPLIAAVGGSWLAPRDKIAAKDWKAIEQNALEARTIIDTARKE